jgi:transposase
LCKIFAIKNTRGRKALTDLINEDELSEWIKLDINRAAGIKCQALISLKNNVSVSNICKVLGVTRESVRLWRKTVEKDGPEGFIKYPKTGKKSGLTDEIKTLLKTVVVQSPERSNYKQAVWDGKLVCRFLDEKKGIKISVRTAQNWLNKINFTRQKPRKKYKKGNDEGIEA